MPAPLKVDLRSPIGHLKGVGPSLAEKFSKLGIIYVYQLLFHLPARYIDYSTILPITDAPLGEDVCIEAKIINIGSRRSWSRRKLTVTTAEVEDDSGTLKVLWFNRPYLTEQYAIGDEVFLAGKISQGKPGSKNPGLQMANPDVESTARQETTSTARLVPVYPLTKGVTQKQLRFFMQQAIQALHEDPEAIPEWLPQPMRDTYNILDTATALHAIHFPDTPEAYTEAKRRFGFQEILLGQLFVQSSKHDLAASKATPLEWKEALYSERLASIPFSLTGAQERSLEQAKQALEQTVPMNMLLEGDVGSGKTLVAALLMDQVVANGFQAALMAPTELLATQHVETLRQLLPNRRINLHTKNTKSNLRTTEIVVGTHALIQQAVEIDRLALAVIDEQHRFGVKQRKALAEHGSHINPHLLSMTATPIPRSLALTLYGDLELALLDEKPAERLPIITTLISPKQRKQAVKAIAQTIERGEQVYIVAPRIATNLADTETDALELEGTADMPSVEDITKLYAKELPDIRIATLHGKLKPDEKDAIMAEFVAGNTDVLVSTTVIEVGVNVPNATLMIIEGADRFGLAQLHQLRGRVGRSHVQSYCYAIPGTEDESITERLHVFAESTNGFELAEYDLSKRGPGAVFGTSQSGFMNQFKMVDFRDTELIESSQLAAKEYITQLEDWPLLAKRLQKFSENVHLE